jgi:hypothetical protein
MGNELVLSPVFNLVIRTDILKVVVGGRPVTFMEGSSLIKVWHLYSFGIMLVGHMGKRNGLYSELVFLGFGIWRDGNTIGNDILNDVSRCRAMLSWRQTFATPLQV